MNKLRIGLVLDSFRVPAWKHELIRRVASEGHGEIVAILISDPPKPVEQFLQPLLSPRYFLYECLRKFELKRFRPRPDAFKIVDLSGLLQQIPVIQLTGGDDGGKTATQLKAFRPDLLVYLASGPCPSRLLDTSPHGVWTIENATVNGSHLALKGFWEVLHSLSTTQISLVRLGRHEGQREVLFNSFSATDRQSVYSTRSRSHWKASSFLPRELRALHELGSSGLVRRAERFEFVPPPFPPLAPTNLAMFCPLLTHLWGLVARKFQRLLFFDQWILLFSLDDGKGMDLTRYRKIVPPKNVVWADPQLIERDGKFFIFLEECPIRPKKGRISVMVMDKDGNWEQPRTIIERPYHLSYPFVFEWNGTLYMIPESSANKTIELYRCKSFPYEWEFEKNLMVHVDAVDTTLIEHGGKWWLFASIRENEGYPNWEELFLFSSDSPLSEAWKPHPLNPIISDVRRARPAGPIFSTGGELYRPSQDCSERYGYGLRINRIRRLTDEEYNEEETAFIEPAWEKKIGAVHTYGRSGNLTILDALYRRSRRW